MCFEKDLGHGLGPARVRIRGINDRLRTEPEGAAEGSFAILLTSFHAARPTKHQMSYSLPELWFERLDRLIGVPTWGGAVLFGWAPFPLLGFFPTALSFFPLPAYIAFTVVDLGLAFFAFYAASYLRRETMGLLKYVGEMGGAPDASSQIDLSRFSSTRRIGIVYVIALVILVPVYAFGQIGRTPLSALPEELPFLWFAFVLATFLWAFGYSMYSIYRMGKLPLKLRPYTEDRMLGLKPFGKASLNSTVMYVGVITAFVLPMAFGGTLPLELAVGFLVLYPVGFLLFLLPLLGLHSKLVAAKREELAWIGPRATSLLQKVKARGGDQFDELVAKEVAVLDVIKRDALQIHNWPFDTGILARLIAILLSVVAVLLSGIIKSFLHI